MAMVTIGCKVGDIDVSVKCEVLELRTGIRNLREAAKEVRKLMAEADTEAVEAGDVPSVAGSGNTSQAVIRLLASEWAAKPKSIRQIKDALEANAIYLPVTTLSSILFNLVKQGRLRRWKSESTKAYVYHRSRGM